MDYYQNSQMDGSSFFWKSGPEGFLLLHGFTATTVEVQTIARIFHRANISISSPLLPGHGTSPDDLNSRKWTEWVECVENAYTDLAKKCKIIYVGGESMGAVLALHLAEHHPEIDALLLYAPAIKVTKLRFARFLRSFIPWIRKSRSSDTFLWQGYTVYPLNAANELRKLQKKVIKNLPNVTQPTAIFLGAYDKTIDPDCGDLIYKNIRSAIKEKKGLNNSGHVMLLGNEIEKIAELSLLFLNSAKTFKS
jgi:carboxylesterase